MDTLWSAVIGWFFGFGFGVGCALAVMYSIYMGGYRAALRDSRMAKPPERLTRTLARLGSGVRHRRPADEAPQAPNA